MTETTKKRSGITINKVYTRTGDTGKTGIIGGKRLSKANIRIRSYGEIDELNVVVGGCKEQLKKLAEHYPDVKLLSEILARIQNELFNLGSMLATPADYNNSKMPRISISNIKILEVEIDRYNENLDTLPSFVLPGGSEVNVWLNLARTVCRRAECTIVELSQNQVVEQVCLQYLNRLSDAFFVWSRWINKICDHEEELWDPCTDNSECDTIVSSDVID